MGHATLEQLKRTSDLLSQGSKTTEDASLLRPTPVEIPGVWELDSKVQFPTLQEMDANQIPAPAAAVAPQQMEPGPSTAHTNHTSHVSNGRVELSNTANTHERVSVDGSGRSTDFAINSPRPHMQGPRQLFSSDTETKELLGIHALAVSEPLITPPPAYNNSSRHSEGYITYRPAPEAVTEEIVRPKSEPRSLTADSIQRQPTPAAAKLESAEERLPHGRSISPSPEIEPFERVPTIPHALPPLSAFEPVSFSITMDSNTFGGGSGLKAEAEARRLDQWRWDIRF
jgi:hypothetical protein